MLKKQHFELLKLMEKEKSLAEIANSLSLTERSVRYKINEINQELGQKRIEIKKRKILYSLTDDDTEKLFETVDNEKYIYSQKEREELIVLYTLFKKNTFLLKEISEKLNTSKSTVRNDIKNLKSILSKYKINLLQDDKLKYYYDYSETDFRYFIAIFLYKYVSFDDKYDKIFFDDISYFRKVIYKEIKAEYMLQIDSVSKRIREAKFDFMDETLNILVILMVVSQKRDKKNKDLIIENVDILKKLEEFTQLKVLFPDFSEENLLFFTDYLFRIGRSDKNIFIKFPNWLSINVGIDKVVRSYEIEAKSDFKNLPKLLNEIFYYIKPLIYRTKKRIELKNSILKDVKELYPEVFAILRKNFYHLEEVINDKVSDDEIAYLTPIFYRACQDNNRVNKKGILVTTYKENVALFLKEEIESEFLIEIDKILTLTKFELSKEDLYKYDYIFTTFNIEESLSNKNKFPKIVELNPILTEKDIKKLEDAGLTKNKKIKMSSLLKVILENSSKVDVKKIVRSLDENFSEKIYNDIEKNRFLLSDFVKRENIVETNFKSFKEILENFLELSFLKKDDINDIINSSKNLNMHSFLNENTAVIFYEKKNNIQEDNILIAVNKGKIKIRNRKIGTLILVSLNCEEKNRLLIYDFVKLFFENKETIVNNDRLKIYDYLISNI